MSYMNPDEVHSVPAGQVETIWIRYKRPAAPATETKKLGERIARAVARAALADSKGIPEVTDYERVIRERDDARALALHCRYVLAQMPTWLPDLLGVEQPELPDWFTGDHTGREFWDGAGQ